MITRRIFSQLLGLSPLTTVTVPLVKDKKVEEGESVKIGDLEIIESVPMGKRLRTVFKFPSGRIEEMYSIYTGSPSIDYPAFKNQLERNVRIAQVWAKKRVNYIGPR